MPLFSAGLFGGLRTAFARRPVLVLVLVSAVGTITALALLVFRGWIVALAFYVVTLLLLGILVSWLQDRYAPRQESTGPGSQDPGPAASFSTGSSVQPDRTEGATITQPPAAGA